MHICYVTLSTCGNVISRLSQQHAGCNRRILPLTRPLLELHRTNPASYGQLSPTDNRLSVGVQESMSARHSQRRDTIAFYIV